MTARSRLFHLIVFSTLLFLGVMSGTNTPVQAGSLQHNRVELTTSRQESPVSEWVEQAIRYVAETYGIAEDVLRLTNEEGLHLPTLDKTILTITFTAMQQPDYPVYRVLIDIDTGEISEDLQALRQAEEEARMQKYGKLETSLFDMLQEADDDDDDDEIFPVAIWAAEYDKRLSPSELYDILAARYPQAAQAMAEGRKPWRVEDKELSKEIRTAYFAELDKNAKTRVAPILAMLKRYEESVEHQMGEPRIVAEIPKKMILKLDRHPAVARIFYYSDEAEPEMDGATSTIRAPGAWARGLSGNGVRIAILEDGRIGTQNVPCLNVVETEYPSAAVNHHKTQVATIAACNPDRPNFAYGDEFKGVAFGAEVIDGGTTSLNWAITTHEADVVNLSETVGDGRLTRNLNDEDFLFDYWVRFGPATIVKSAGNECFNNSNTCNITSPGKGWNVLTVGGFDDNNNALWADDGNMLRYSSYWNPVTGVEKPEVVAPASNITSLDGVGSPLTQMGTSLAAPQVAGLAALMMEEHEELRGHPEAVKAIIMASAVHDITTTTHWNPYLRINDEVDGAGAIDADLAVQVAATRDDWGTCMESCWGVRFLTERDGTLWKTFYAFKGDRVRVAISWLSHGVSPDFMQLGSNLNLTVTTQNGKFTASDNSSYNNHELVDFTAPESGLYTIAVNNFKTIPGTNTFVGIAVAKQSTHLINVRSDFRGWETRIYGTSTDVFNQPISNMLYDSGGGAVDEVSYSLPPMGRYEFDPLPGNFLGYIQLNGQESIAAVAESSHYGDTLATNLSGASSQSFSPTAWYLPAIFKHSASLVSNINSAIYLLNTGHDNETVRVHFIDDASGNQGYKEHTLSPHQQIELNLKDNCSASAPSGVCSGFAGAAMIEDEDGQDFSADVIASVVTTWHDSLGNVIRASQYSAVQHGAPMQAAPYPWRLYGPTVFRIKDTNGIITHKSAVRLQNSSEEHTASVSLTFTPRADNSGNCLVSHTLSTSVAPKSSVGFNTANNSLFAALDNGGLCSEWRGTVSVESTQPLAGIVNTMWSTVRRSGSHAMFRPEDARAVVVFPRQMRDSDNWSRVSVMNIANEEVAVRVDFYDTNGGRVYRHPDMELDAGEAVVLNTASLLGGHFEGTAVAYSVPLIRPAPQTDIPIRPSLVGVGDLMYSDGHADGNRAAIYEGIGQ